MFLLCKWIEGVGVRIEGETLAPAAATQSSRQLWGPLPISVSLESRRPAQCFPTVYIVYPQVTSPGWASLNMVASNGCQCLDLYHRRQSAQEVFIQGTDISHEPGLHLQFQRLGGK